MRTSLSPELIASIRLRIQDPRRRSAVPQGEAAGVVDDPGRLAELFGSLDPTASRAWGDVVKQMEQWGQKMPPMHVTRYSDGSLSASSEDPDGYPIAPPADEAGFALLESKLGRPIPQDVRQLYAIADGGFGPGNGFTSGFGYGLYSLERVGQEYDDLCRRGPDYTGAIAWPRHFLPLTDNVGAVAYDLDRGVIVEFNEYWEDDLLTSEQAFRDIHPSLESWLGAWLQTDGNGM